MSQPKFELFRSEKNRQYYFRLKNQHGEITLASEGYTNSTSRQNGIESVKANAPLDSRYERKTGSTGFTFNLKAGNGEIIGRSQVFKTAALRDQDIESVKADAPVAGITDLG